MLIQSVEIKNLRSIKEAIVPLDSYTCLLGPNGAGKSTLLCALNIFFRETNNSATDLVYLTSEDFHHQDTSQPIEITVTFVGLQDEAKVDFKEYYRHEKLIISAIAKFDDTANKAEVKQYGQRLAMGAFSPFFKAYGDGEKVGVLKEIFAQLCEQYPAISKASTKDGMAEALRLYEAERPDECALIPSEDQFYGVSRGVNRLQKYLQWVYVPAVKDASDEQLENKTSALGKLLARTVRSKVNFDGVIEELLKEVRQKYEGILLSNQPALDEISTSLKNRLTQWAHPNASLRLAWHQDPSRSIRVEDPLAKIIAGESGFEGDLARFGHGFQRSYLLALLQELASIEVENAPRLILGCEEPELYQHPPQAKHLASVLYKLGQNNTQVIITTHSPCFVTGDHFETIRMVRQNDEHKYSTVKFLTHQQISERFATVVGEPLHKPTGGMAKLHQSLQSTLSDMFFTQRLVLVEGQEDSAYLHTWLALTDKIEDYRRTGCHIVPANKKSEIIRALIIAQGLCIPTFTIFDADGDSKNKERELHERDNRALLKLLEQDEVSVFPEFTTITANSVIWPTDLSSIVDADLLSTLGMERFSEISNKAHHLYGHEGGLKKNTLFISAKLALAWESGGHSPALEAVCNQILQFGTTGG
ncbi:MAG: ATP-dependent nuclease [Methylophilus sp.]|uniref:ATP-dependent nuclease n=1 Tax=Methylophilus sp. TaxID=29541 RepID=UPI004036AA4E